MALLRNEDLHAALNAEALSERLVVMPLLDKSQVGPASIDVRLGTQFQFFERMGVAGLDAGADFEQDVERSQRTVAIEFGEPLWLHPGQFALGSTLEFLRLPPTLGAYVVGRSSWGRIGLLVATAIMLQPGWGGNLTLELTNQGESPIALYAGASIAQIAIHTLTDKTEKPYRGKYMAPTGPWASQLGKERERIEALRDVAGRLGGRTR